MLRAAERLQEDGQVYSQMRATACARLTCAYEVIAFLIFFILVVASYRFGDT